MIMEWYGTNVEDFSRMTEITDEDILEVSSGEVTRPSDDGSDDENWFNSYRAKGALADEEIFGSAEDLRFGHIDLGCPVVNINYLYGPRPVLPKLLGMTKGDIDRVLYRAANVCVDKESADYKKLTKTWEDEDLGGEVMSGAEAIERLLENENIEERKYVILHVLPVLPLDCRFVIKEGSCRVKQLNDHYVHLLYTKERVRRLTELGAPKIILINEERMLQEAADALINNGARGPARGGLIPCDSLYEYWRMISDPLWTCGKPDISEDLFDKEAFDKICEEWEEFNETAGEDVEGCSGVRSFSKEEEKMYDEFDKRMNDVLRPIGHEVYEKSFSSYEGSEEYFVKNFLPGMTSEVWELKDSKNAFDILVKSAALRMEFAVKGVA